MPKSCTCQLKSLTRALLIDLETVDTIKYITRGQILVESLPFLCLISFLKNGLANLGPTHLTFFKNLSLKLGAMDDLFWRCGTFGKGSFVDSFHITATAGTIEI